MKKNPILFLLVFLCSCNQDYDYFSIELPHDNPNDDYINFKDNINILVDKIQIITSSDGDTNVSKGESIDAQIYLRNIGESDATNVYVNVSSTSAFFDNNFISNINFGTIYANSNGKTNNNVSFKIKNTAPDSDYIPLQINITDGKDHSWLRNYNLKIVKTKAKMAAYSFEIKYYNPSRYGYVAPAIGSPQPGDFILGALTLINNSNVKVYGVNCLVSQNSPYLSNYVFRNVSPNFPYGDPNTPLNYADFYANQKVNFPIYVNGNYLVGGIWPVDRYIFYANLLSNTPRGTKINFPLKISDSYNNNWLDTVNFIVK